MASPPLLDRPPLPLTANTAALTPITGAILVRGAAASAPPHAGAGAGSPGPGTDVVPYSGGGAGGKVRSSRRASIARSKKTPYARPASGRHATPGGTGAAAAASSGSSIASRLVDSASWLISSSASYLLSSFFVRRSLPAIANGDAALPASVSASEEEAEEVLVEAPVDRADKHNASPPDHALVLVGESAETEKRVMDIEQVEEIIKQQTWSREQVNRLTEILQTRVLENNSHPKSEAQRWREDLKKARNDATPIEVARAYMGERTRRPSGIATPIQGSVHQIDRVADLQPPPGLGLIEDRFRFSPVVRTWARSSGPVRTPKRSAVLDEEWASVGPIRRTRQKSLMLANASPYARGVTGSSTPSRTFTSPPIQSSQTARKILETLEKLTPSPKGKSVEGELKVATEGLPTEPTAVVPKVQERKSLQISEFSRLPKMTEPGPSSGKLTLEPSATLDSRAVEKSVTHSSPPLMVGSPTVIPERTKGFRMSAVFEESNSDEDNRLNSKLKLPTSEAQTHVILSETREAPQFSSLPSFKPSSAPVATTAPAISSADVSVTAAKSLPSTSQTNVSQVSTKTFSTTIQSGSSPAVQSSGSAAISSSVSFTFGVQSGTSLSGQSSGLLPTSAQANLFSVVNGDANIASDAVVTSATSLSTTAAPLALPTASSALPVVGGLFVGNTLPAAAAASTGVLVDTATAIEDLSEGENGTIMATEGPSADKQVDADVMTADPMSEEPDSFAMSSSPPSFTFGSSSAATSTSTLPTFNFGSSSAGTLTSSLPAFTFGASVVSSPSSTFSFAVQSSGTATTASSSTSFAFGGQSATSSSGSVFAFGAPSTPLSASPFSLSRTPNTTPSFTFGSSPAVSSSASPTFPATPSALPSFSISSSAAPLFSFGAHAASSPLSSSSSAGHLFGFGASSAANPFSTAGAGNSSPAFTFSSSPAAASSAAPIFSFGGGAGTSASSGSSFAGQSFAFGAQHSPAASPFSPAASPSTVPSYQFGSSSAVSAMPSLSFGSTAASSPSPTFAFGGQSMVSPASSTPFTFGGQTGAAPAVQPFSFGGQPAVPAQSPFSSPGASNTFSQPGLEFTGGFALGATGGEKSGRKFIKAKRRK